MVLVRCLNEYGRAETTHGFASVVSDVAGSALRSSRAASERAARFDDGAAAGAECATASRAGRATAARAGGEHAGAESGQSRSRRNLQRLRRLSGTRRGA